MSCQTVQNFISAYVDESLAAEERHRVTHHLAHCRDCAKRCEQVHHLRVMLQSLPVASPHPGLATRLQVVASHERARRLARVDLPTRLENWVAKARLFMDNLMRPVALPFAGGLASALFLFTMLVPTLCFQFNSRNDVPVSAFYTEPTLVEAAPFGFLHDDAIVELTLNEKGLVTDYTVQAGKMDRQAESNLMANLVLFSSYSPATLFGRPTSGKVTVSFRRSRIVVRG